MSRPIILTNKRTGTRAGTMYKFHKKFEGCKFEWCGECRVLHGSYTCCQISAQSLCNEGRSGYFVPTEERWHKLEED